MSWIVIIGAFAVVILFPFIVYLAAKMATLGYYKGKEAFARHKKSDNNRERNNGQKP